MIGIDAHVLGDHSGGNETYYKNIIENFNDEQSKNIIIFVKKDFKTGSVNFNGQIVRFKSSSAFIRLFFEIPYLTFKYKLDLLHMQYFIPFIRLCPVVTSIHDISFEHFNDIFSKKTYLLQKLLIPYAARKSDRVLTISEYSKNDIAKKYNVSSKKIAVTYLGVSKEFKKNLLNNDDKKYLLNRYSIPEKYFLSVGNLQPRKNIKRLLNAYLQFCENQSDSIPIVIVGKKDWMVDEIFQEISNSKYKELVILTGYVSSEDLVKIYNQATLFVYPSIFEGFGLPIVEAMACGVPVATSNISSIPEVAGDACYLFDPYNTDEIYKSLIELYSNEKKREKMIAEGFNQSKKFNWEITSTQIFEVYNEVIT